MSGISTHILDTSLGQPAAGVHVSLECRGHGGLTWVMLAEGRTDGDGRCRPLLPAEQVSDGVFRLRFHIAPYFHAQGRSTLYPEVTVMFTVPDGRRDVHIPLLLNPFGYTTYLGT